MELQCMKCGATITVPSDRVDIGTHPDFGERVAFIGAGEVWSGRHDGEPLTCPYHPGMTYFLYPTGEDGHCEQDGCTESAVWAVHWPGKTTNQCDDHSAKVVALGLVMGFKVTTTLLETGEGSDNGEA